MTYENILNEMLEMVPSDVDKREGSIIYDALAPSAYKMAEYYFMLSNYIDLVFGDTAVGEYLDRVVADYGLSRRQATHSLRKIETDAPISIGTRWGLDDTTYIVTENISDIEYYAECEQLGEIGNSYSGELDNIDNVNGVTAHLTDVIIPGANEESDESLRERFYNQVRKPSTSGNAVNYVQWALEVPGVGDVKVFPLWSGPGTVKVLIVDSNMAINEPLEQAVYEYIELVRPIGATVTVDSPTGVEINVDAGVTLDGSRTLQEVQIDFQAAFTEYLKDTVFETYTVSYAKIGSILLSTPGVSDYSNLLVNNNTMNVDILDEEMPIEGTIALSEVV